MSIHNYPYTPKNLRPVPVKIKLSSRLVSHTTAYCHIEEKWKPIELFEFYKINVRGFVPLAICIECMAKELRLFNIYNKKGYLKEEIRQVQIVNQSHINHYLETMVEVAKTACSTNL